VFGPTSDHRKTAADNVRGTEDLVRALAAAAESEAPSSEAPALCHLILTSSMAAVRASGQAPSNGRYYTDKDWNTQSKNGEGSSWGESYQWSKAESERRARELGRELGLPVTAVCPSFVFGPPRGGGASGGAASPLPSESYSLTLVDEWIRGASPVQSRLFVDVRDVARAHVSAAANPTVSAGQRYIVSTEARVPSQEMAGWLRDACLHQSSSGGGAVLDPSKIRYDSEYVGGAIPIGEREVESTERLERDLGVALRPVKDTMVEMARALISRHVQQQEQNDVEKTAR
jgi:nucleoside-diphosphate-sugar epimerase